MQKKEKIEKKGAVARKVKKGKVEKQVAKSEKPKKPKTSKIKKEKVIFTFAVIAIIITLIALGIVSFFIGMNLIEKFPVNDTDVNDTGFNESSFNDTQQMIPGSLSDNQTNDTTPSTIPSTGGPSGGNGDCDLTWTNTEEFRCDANNSRIRKQTNNCNSNVQWIDNDCLENYTCYDGENAPADLCINQTQSCIDFELGIDYDTKGYANKTGTSAFWDICSDTNVIEYYCFYNNATNETEVRNETGVCSSCSGGACFIECTVDVDCVGNNVPEIANCINNPDNFDFTWDYAPANDSECVLEVCTIPTQPTIVSSCDISNCRAECEVDGNCNISICVGDQAYYNVTCNSTCDCDYIDTEDCNLHDGWYDTGNIQWIDLIECVEKEQKEQEDRDYTCSVISPPCNDYSILSTQWVDNGNVRNKTSGEDCSVGVCDGNGVCVECVDDNDCDIGAGETCQANICVPFTPQQCSDCGLFGLFCDYTECHTLGDCYWDDNPWPLPNNCTDRLIACQSINDCTEYSDAECEFSPPNHDFCNVAPSANGCYWDGDSCENANYCGDGNCDAGEDCGTCSGDCSCSGATPYCDAGNCVECLNAGNCIDNECYEPICDFGSCGETPVPAYGNDESCFAIDDEFCDGFGSCVECLIGGDCDDANACTIDSCLYPVCDNSPILCSFYDGTTLLECESNGCGLSCVWNSGLCEVVATNTYYIIEGGRGSQNGSDWTNADNELPAVLQRNYTYYIADGSYHSSGYTFNDAAVGTQEIIIKKATETEHGTNVGWQIGDGDGQAVFGPLIFTTNYYVFDGQYEYGFRVVGSYMGYIVNIPSDYVIIRNTDLDGNFQTDAGGQQNDGVCNGVQIDGSYVTIENNDIYNIADDGMGVYGNNIRIIGNRIHNLHSCGCENCGGWPGNGECGPCYNGHSDIIEIFTSTDGEIRNNLVYSGGQGVNAALFFGGIGFSNNFTVSNNIFYAPEALFIGVMQNIDDLKMYNNVFWQGYYGGIAMGLGVTDFNIYNNIIHSINYYHFRNVVPPPQGDPNHAWNPAEHHADYNFIANPETFGYSMPLGSNSIDGTGYGADVGFVNIPAIGGPANTVPVPEDFMLLGSSPAIDAGTEIGVYEDIEGTLRPQDGDNSGTAEFDIGAYEYTGAPPAPSTAIIINHTAVEQFDLIPDSYIERIKNMSIQIVGQSHGTGIPWGLQLLENLNSKYAVQFSTDCPPVWLPSQRLSFTEGDGLKVERSYYTGSAWTIWLVGEESYWATETGRLRTETTAQQAINEGRGFNISLWHWCWDISGNSANPNRVHDEDGTLADNYFNDTHMESFKNAFTRFNNNPAINQTKFVYYTSITDAPYSNPNPDIANSSGRITHYNNVIRQETLANNGILFDQADIENWDYNNIASYSVIDDFGQVVYPRNPEYLEGGIKYGIDDTWSYDHCHDILDIRKAKALWVLLAHMQGWDGVSECVVDTDCDAGEVCNTATGFCEIEIPTMSGFSKAWNWVKDLFV